MVYDVTYYICEICGKEHSVETHAEECERQCRIERNLKPRDELKTVSTVTYWVCEGCGKNHPTKEHAENCELRCRKEGKF